MSAPLPERTPLQAVSELFFAAFLRCERNAEAARCSHRTASEASVQAGANRSLGREAVDVTSTDNLTP